MTSRRAYPPPAWHAVRGRSGVRRRPVVDSRQRLAHENRLVAVGQAIGDTKRLDPS